MKEATLGALAISNAWPRLFFTSAAPDIDRSCELRFKKSDLLKFNEITSHHVTCSLFLSFSYYNRNG